MVECGRRRRRSWWDSVCSLARACGFASLPTGDPLASYAAAEPVPEPQAVAPAAPHGPAQPATPPAGTLRTERSVDPGWVVVIADNTGIPGRALEAYANATLRIADEQPGCRLSWPTLAGVGAIESGHGTADRPIIGVPLDGAAGVAQIGDTDDGRLDGDARWDRAVGPMQFIPSTWSRWGADADGDGLSDPHSIDDSTLAAARYLCASGGDLTRGDAWHLAVLSYNHSEEYVEAVRLRADAFATESRR